MVHGGVRNGSEGCEKSELYPNPVCYIGAELKIQDLVEDLDWI